MQRLIRKLSRENPLWGAERIRDTLLLLGYPPVCDDTIRKCMVRWAGRVGDHAQAMLAEGYREAGSSVSTSSSEARCPTARPRSSYLSESGRASSESSSGMGRRQE